MVPHSDMSKSILCMFMYNHIFLYEQSNVNIILSAPRAVQHRTLSRSPSRSRRLELLTPVASHEEPNNQKTYGKEDCSGMNFNSRFPRLSYSSNPGHVYHPQQWQRGIFQNSSRSRPPGFQLEQRPRNRNVFYQTCQNPRLPWNGPVGTLGFRYRGNIASTVPRFSSTCRIKSDFKDARNSSQDAHVGRPVLTSDKSVTGTAKQQEPMESSPGKPKGSLGSSEEPFTQLFLKKIREAAHNVHAKRVKEGDMGKTESLNTGSNIKSEQQLCKTAEAAVGESGVKEKLTPEILDQKELRDIEVKPNLGNTVEKASATSCSSMLSEKVSGGHGDSETISLQDRNMSVDDCSEWHNPPRKRPLQNVEETVKPAKRMKLTDKKLSDDDEGKVDTSNFGNNHPDAKGLLNMPVSTNGTKVKNHTSGVSVAKGMKDICASTSVLSDLPIPSPTVTSYALSKHDKGMPKVSTSKALSGQVPSQALVSKALSGQVLSRVSARKASSGQMPSQASTNKAPLEQLPSQASTSNATYEQVSSQALTSEASSGQVSSQTQTSTSKYVPGQVSSQTTTSKFAPGQVSSQTSTSKTSSEQMSFQAFPSKATSRQVPSQALTSKASSGQVLSQTSTSKGSSGQVSSGALASKTTSEQLLSKASASKAFSGQVSSQTLTRKASSGQMSSKGSTNKAPLGQVPSQASTSKVASGQVLSQASAGKASSRQVSSPALTSKALSGQVSSQALTSKVTSEKVSFQASSVQGMPKVSRSKSLSGSRSSEKPVVSGFAKRSNPIKPASPGHSDPTLSSSPMPRGMVSHPLLGNYAGWYI